jgi:hypothetical protein
MNSVGDANEVHFDKSKIAGIDKNEREKGLFEDI